jgi:rod shape-determining protein MreC
MSAGLIFFFAPQHWGNKLQFSFSRILAAPLSLGRKLSLPMGMRGVSAGTANTSRYSLLRNELANIKERLALEREKVERLSGLRDRSVWNGVSFVLADIITATHNGARSRLVINRGANDGLAVGQFVLGDNSIIGTISEIDSRTAQVALITDPTSKIAVKISEGRDIGSYNQAESGAEVEAIMQGAAENSAKVLLVPARHKVELGGVVYAQKKPGFLDTATITAIVSKFKRDAENPLLWDITVEPACEIEGLKEVAVVVMNPQE